VGKDEDINHHYLRRSEKTGAKSGREDGSIETSYPSVFVYLASVSAERHWKHSWCLHPYFDLPEEVRFISQSSKKALWRMVGGLTRSAGLAIAAPAMPDTIPAPSLIANDRSSTGPPGQRRTIVAFVMSYSPIRRPEYVDSRTIEAERPLKMERGPSMRIMSTRMRAKLVVRAGGTPANEGPAARVVAVAEVVACASGETTSSCCRTLILEMRVPIRCMEHI
jgi:hypothetical protein